MVGSLCKSKVKIASLLALCLLAEGESAFGDEYQRIYRSAYYLGRGDTGIATADDQEAIFYNPAGLAYGTGIYKRTILLSPELEISKDARDLARETALEKNAVDIDRLRQHEGKPEHIGFNNFSGIIFRRAAIVAVESGGTNILVHKSPDAGGLEAIDAKLVADAGLTFSVAEGFFNNFLMLGTTAKYLKRGEAQASLSVLDADKISNLKASDFYGTGTGVGADIGMMLRDDKSRLPWGVGLTVENVGKTHFVADQTTTALEDLKQTVNVGFSVEPGTKFSRLKLFLDVRDLTGATETDAYKRTHLGADLNFRGLMGVTAGLNQGYPTGGLYADLYFVRIDVGAYTEEVGKYVGDRPDPRYFMRLQAGF